MRFFFWRRGGTEKRRASEVAAENLSQQITDMSDNLVQQQTKAASGIANLTRTVQDIAKLMERDGARLHNGRS